MLLKTFRQALITILAVLNLGNASFGQEINLKPVQARLSLTEAQGLALKQNPEILQATLEINKREAFLRSIIAQRLPQTLAIGFGGQQMNDDHGRQFLLLPVVLQPVTQQYRLGLEVHEARVLVDISRQRLRLARQRTIAKVRVSYLSMLALQSAIASLQQHLGFLKELEQYVESEVKRGAALSVDALLVQARVSRADYEVDRARDDLTTMMQTFNRMLGRPPRSEMILVDQTASPLAQSDEAAELDRAFAMRPELNESKLNIHRDNLESHVQLAGYIPDVSVGFLGSFSNNFDPAFPRHYAAVGFLATWEPWDWGRRIDLSRAQLSEMQQERIKLNDLSEAVSIEVDAARRAVRVAQKEAQAGALAELSTKEQLRVVHRRFTAGATLLKDVLEAQSDYLKAIADNVKAKTDIAKAQAELDEALGRDY